MKYLNIEPRQVDAKYLKLFLDLYGEDLPDDLPFLFGVKWEIIIDLDRGVIMNWHYKRDITLEFKVVELVPAGKAIQQLRNKGYAEKYRSAGPVYLIGVEFSRDSRNIVGFETETLT